MRLAPQSSAEVIANIAWEKVGVWRGVGAERDDHERARAAEEQKEEGDDIDFGTDSSAVIVEREESEEVDVRSDAGSTSSKSETVRRWNQGRRCGDRGTSSSSSGQQAWS